MNGPFDRPPWYQVDFDMQIADPALADIYRHWLSIRRTGDVPVATDFDPLDVARHLGILFMVRVENPGDAEPLLRYSLIGTRLVEVLERDTTGKIVGDTFPEGHPVVLVYRHAITHRLPVRTFGRLDWAGKPYRQFESVLLPMADAEGRIVKFLGAAAYR